MFFEYVKEKDGCETLQSEGGFLCYTIAQEQKQLYIAHFFVHPDFRKSPAHFLELMGRARAVAEENGLEFFGCHVALENGNLNHLLVSYLKFGFRVVGQDKFGLALTLSLKDAAWLKKPQK